MLTERLHHGDGVLDIGANIGALARRFAEAVGASGCVLAVEPDPETARQLREALAVYPQCEVAQMAVGDASGARTLHRDTCSARHSFWSANLLEPSGGAVDVSVTTLDALAERVPHLRGIKIDAQGAEALILDGASATLPRREIHWFVELWRTGLEAAGSSVAAVAERFTRHGLHPVGTTWAAVVAHTDHEEGHAATDVLLEHRDA